MRPGLEGVQHTTPPKSWWEIRDSSILCLMRASKAYTFQPLRVQEGKSEPLKKPCLLLLHSCIPQISLGSCYLLYLERVFIQECKPAAALLNGLRSCPGSILFPPQPPLLPLLPPVSPPGAWIAVSHDSSLPVLQILSCTWAVPPNSPSVQLCSGDTLTFFWLTMCLPNLLSLCLHLSLTVPSASLSLPRVQCHPPDMWVHSRPNEDLEGLMSCRVVVYRKSCGVRWTWDQNSALSFTSTVNLGEAS